MCYGWSGGLVSEVKGEGRVAAVCQSAGKFRAALSRVSFTPSFLCVLFAPDHTSVANRLALAFSSIYKLH